MLPQETRKLIKKYNLAPILYKALGITRGAFSQKLNQTPRNEGSCYDFSEEQRRIIDNKLREISEKILEVTTKTPSQKD